MRRSVGNMPTGGRLFELLKRFSPWSPSPGPLRGPTSPHSLLWGEVGPRSGPGEGDQGENLLSNSNKRPPVGMLPTERLIYSPIAGREPLKLPDGKRMVVWCIV